MAALCGLELACHCRPEERCHADVLLALLAATAQPERRPGLAPGLRVVAQLMAMCSTAGADLRVDADREAACRAFPRMEVDIDYWRWKVGARRVWR